MLNATLVFSLESRGATLQPPQSQKKPCPSLCEQEPLSCLSCGELVAHEQHCCLSSPGAHAPVSALPLLPPPQLRLPLVLDTRDRHPHSVSGAGPGAGVPVPRQSGAGALCRCRCPGVLGEAVGLSGHTGQGLLHGERAGLVTPGASIPSVFSLGAGLPVTTATSGGAFLLVIPEPSAPPHYIGVNGAHALYCRQQLFL